MNPKTVVSGYRLIVGYLGYFMMFGGGIVLLPLLVLFFYPNETVYLPYFVIPGVVSIFIGYLLSLAIQHHDTAHLERHQDAVLIVLIWGIAILIGSAPFWMTGEYTFSQSIFEATSGFTTTGLSIVDVSQAPHIFLMHRSILQFFGGIGLVIVLASAISDKYGVRLYNAEGHTDKLLPNLFKSARLVVSLYSAYVLIGSLIYFALGMPYFDSLNHAIAAISTGGFSTVADSIGHYHSIAIEIVTMVLMLIGQTNLLIHLMLFQRKFKQAFLHIETLLFIVLLAVILPILVGVLQLQTQLPLPDAIRIALFQYISAITTTGFQTIPTFQTLPSLFNLLLIIGMVIGGGIGSTAGAIKQYRIGLGIKQLFWDIRDRFTPPNVIHAYTIQRFGKQTKVTTTELTNNFAFITMYLGILIIGTLIFMTQGSSLLDALFEFASALGTVGLSIGVLQSTSASYMLWTASLGMLLGRLEIYVVFMAFGRIWYDLVAKRSY